MITPLFNLALLLFACGRGADTGLQPSEEDHTSGDSADTDDTDEPLDPIYSMSEDDLPQGADPCRAPVVVEVTEAVDGDTLWVHGPAGSEKVRIIGVDTPEISHNGDPPDCYGPEAAAFTEEQLLGRYVWLTFDGDCEDDYGRTLAYVTSGEGETGFFERLLLQGGWAETMTFSATSTYARTFESDEAAAIAAGEGMWGACD